MKKTRKAKFIAAVLSFVMIPAMIPMNLMAVWADDSNGLPFEVRETAYGVHSDEVTAKQIVITDSNTEILTGRRHPSKGFSNAGYVALQQKLSSSQYRYYIIGKSGEVVHSFTSGREQDSNLAALSMSAVSGADFDYPSSIYTENVIGEKQILHTDSIYAVRKNGSEDPDLFNATTEEYIKGDSFKSGYVIYDVKAFSRDTGAGIILELRPKNSDNYEDRRSMLLDIHGNPLYSQLYKSIELEYTSEDGISVYRAETENEGKNSLALLTSTGIGTGNAQFCGISGGSFRIMDGFGDDSDFYQGFRENFVTVSRYDKEGDVGYGVYSLNTGKVLGDAYDDDSPIYMWNGKFLVGQTLVSDSSSKTYGQDTYDVSSLVNAGGGFFSISRYNYSGGGAVTQYKAENGAAIATIDSEDQVGKDFYGGLRVDANVLYGPEGNVIGRANMNADEYASGFQFGPYFAFQLASPPEGSYNVNDYLSNVYDMRNGDLIFENTNLGEDELIASRGIVTLYRTNGKLSIASYQTGRVTEDIPADESDKMIRAAVMKKNGSLYLTSGGRLIADIDGSESGTKATGLGSEVLLTQDLKAITWDNDTNKFTVIDPAKGTKKTFQGPEYIDVESYQAYDAILTESSSGNYGLVSRSGETILKNDYPVLGLPQRGVLLAADGDVSEDTITAGVMGINGEWLVHGSFMTAWEWNNGGDRCYTSRIGSDPAAVFVSGNGKSAYFYDLSEIVEGPAAGDSVELESTYPENGAENVKQENKDITLTFSGDVDFLFDRKVSDTGSIKIKDSQGAVVLEYNILTGSRLGEVCYKNSVNRKTLVLRNALTGLKTGNTYSVSMDNRCIRPKGSRKWYEGFGANQLTFTMGGESAPESDLTYLAACILEQKGGVVGQGISVDKAVSSSKSLRELIWKDKQNRYSGFLSKELGSYQIEKVKEAAVDSGYVVLKNPDTGRRIVIVSMSTAYGMDLQETYVTDAYKMLASLTEDYEKGSFVYTGVGSGGMLAAFAGSIDNVKTVTFNAPISVGIDAAFGANDDAITEFGGIDVLPVTNYSDSLFSVFKNKGVHNLALWHNLNGRAGDLNALFNFRNGNYVFQETLTEDKPNTSRIHINMKPSDLKDILKTFAAKEGFIEVNALKAGWKFLTEIGTEVDMGLSAGNKAEPLSPLREQIMYSGEAPSGKQDLSFGGVEKNIFVHTKGNAQFVGSLKKDLYYINGPGTIEVTDFGAPQSVYKEAKKIEKDIEKLRKTAGVRGATTANLKKFKSLAKSFQSVLNGKHLDAIVLNVCEADRSKLVKEGDQYYFRTELPNGALSIKLPKASSTSFLIIGQNDTEIHVTPFCANMEELMGANHSSGGGAEGKSLEDDESYENEISGFNEVNADYDLHSVVVRNGAAGTFSLKDANGEESESSSMDQWVGKHYMILEDEETGDRIMTVDQSVNTVAFTDGGMTLQTTSLSQPDEKYYVFTSNQPMTIDLANEQVIAGGSAVTPAEEAPEAEEPVITGLSVIPPKKTVYLVGEDSDWRGMEVYPVYSDGSERDALTTYSIAGFASNHPGEIGVSIDAIIDGQSFSTVVPMTIVDPADAVQSITVNESLDLQVGKSLPLEIACDPADTEPLDLIITSSNEDVVRIAGTYVYGENPGTAEITIRDPYNFASATCQVTVTGEAIDYAVREVEALIQAIGAEIDASSKTAILEAVEAYNALTDEQKAKVSNYENLVDAATAYEKKTGEKIPGIETKPGDDDPDDNWKENINDYGPYLTKKTYVYTGKAIKPAVKTRYGTIPTWNKKYTNNVKIGKGTVTLTGKGDYCGTCKLTFTINPAKANLKSVKPGKKKMTVNITKGKGGVQYQIAYKLNKGKWKTKTSKKPKLVIKKLKSKKKYTVRVRYFKKVGKKTYYGAWSKVKTVKIK